MPRPHVLVLCRPFLGDQILSGPVFRNLRAWRPDARIVAACYAEWLEPLSLFPEIDDVLAIPRRRAGSRTASAMQWLALARRVRRERFDVVYDLMQADRLSLRSSLVTLLTRAPVRVSFIERRRKLRHALYTHIVDWTELQDVHTRDRYLTGLAELGVPVNTRSIAVSPDAQETAFARAHLARLLPGRGRPLVIVHPGAGQPEKCWPVANFASVIRELQTALATRVLVIGGAGDAPLLRELRSAVPAGVAFLEQALPVRALAAVLREADLFIGNDSGPMHLAAAVGTPVIALFGASSPERWRPLGPHHTVIRPRMPCESCSYTDRCVPPEPGRMLCVRRIDTEEVHRAVIAWLVSGAHESWDAIPAEG